MFIKYTDFKFSLNENVQQAKTYMKNRALRAKVAEVGPGSEESKTGISAEEVRQAESGNIDRAYDGPLRKYFQQVNPDYKKVRDMLAQQPGWTYMFTKFYFDEDVAEDMRPSIEDLQSLYDNLIDLRQSLNKLPMDLIRYPSIKPGQNPEFEGDQRGGYERLTDDLEKLKDDKKVKKFTSELTGHLASEYESAPPVIKTEIANIAVEFSKLGEENGVVDKEVNHRLQRLFFSAMKDDKTLRDFIARAKRHITSTNNAGLSKFLQLIDKANEKFGSANGAKIVYNQDDILIIEVFSYVANALLNGGTRHCIARAQSYWNSYVGGDNLDERSFNKQYYIYNFKLSPSDNKSVIGITIGQGSRLIYACHLKDDASFGDRIKDYMKSIKVPFEVLAPMSKDEVEKKKKRIEANRGIVKEKISLEQCKKYIEDGADPNAQTGIALTNAVKEDNFEKTEYLLKVGAAPNIGKSIKEARNLPMIKLLVSNGADLTGDVFQKLFTPQQNGRYVKRDPKTGDMVELKGEDIDKAKKETYDAVKYVLDAGMDPNFEQTISLRKATSFGDINIVKLLVNNGAHINARRYMSVRIACEFGQLEILKYYMDLIDKSKDPSIKVDFDVNTEYGQKSQKKFYSDMAVWASTSDKVPNKMKDEIVDFVEENYWKRVSEKPITSADSQIRNYTNG